MSESEFYRVEQRKPTGSLQLVKQWSVVADVDTAAEAKSRIGTTCRLRHLLPPKRLGVPGQDPEKENQMNDTSLMMVYYTPVKEGVTIAIPKTRFDEFCKQLKEPNGQRHGQRFYDFMELHKVTSPVNRAWADRLYNAQDDTALFMIRCRLDYAN